MCYQLPACADEEREKKDIQRNYVIHIYKFTLTTTVELDESSLVNITDTIDFLSALPLGGFTTRKNLSFWSITSWYTTEEKSLFLSHEKNPTVTIIWATPESKTIY